MVGATSESNEAKSCESLRLLQNITVYTVVSFINGFTRADFMDLGKINRDIDLLTIFVIRVIRTSRQCRHRVNCTESIR